MANVLGIDKKIAVIGALAEGSSIRSKPDKHVTVLHVPPVVSPITAVRAFIRQEYANANPA
jgi:hypothetical protein